MKNLKSRAFPSFFKDYAPKLIEFFGVWVDWLNEKENAAYIIDHLSSERDIDASIDAYKTHIRQKLMADYPDSIASDLKLLLKNIFYLYNAKSSIKSYDFLFRCLFNSPAIIRYPKDNILRASDGRWIIKKYLLVTGCDVSQLIKNCMSFCITGYESGATAYINGSGGKENAFSNSILLAGANGEFTNCEHIYITNPDTNEIIDTISYKNDNNEEKIIEVSDICVDYSYEEDTGSWEGQRGFLNTPSIVIQDSHYYQDFSYVIQSTVSIHRWRNLVKNIIHPAGLEFFGDLLLSGDDDGDGIGENYVNPMDFLRKWHLFFKMYVFDVSSKISFNEWVRRVNVLAQRHSETQDAWLYYGKYHQKDGFTNLLVDTANNYFNRSSVLLFRENGTLIHPEIINWGLFEFTEDIDGNTIHGITLNPESHVISGEIHGNSWKPEYEESLIKDNFFVFTTDTATNQHNQVRGFVVGNEYLRYTKEYPNGEDYLVRDTYISDVAKRHSPNIIYQINDINGNRVYYVQGNNYITTDHAGDEKVFYIKDNTIVDYSSDMIAFHLTEDGGWVDIRNKKDLFIKETIVNDDGDILYFIKNNGNIVDLENNVLYYINDSVILDNTTKNPKYFIHEDNRVTNTLFYKKNNTLVDVTNEKNILTIEEEYVTDLNGNNVFKVEGSKFIRINNNEVLHLQDNNYVTDDNIVFFTQKFIMNSDDVVIYLINKCRSVTNKQNVKFYFIEDNVIYDINTSKAKYYILEDNTVMDVNGNVNYYIEDNVILSLTTNEVIYYIKNYEIATNNKDYFIINANTLVDNRTGKISFYVNFDDSLTDIREQTVSYRIGEYLERWENLHVEDYITTSKESDYKYNDRSLMKIPDNFVSTKDNMYVIENRSFDHEKIVVYSHSPRDFTHRVFIDRENNKVNIYYTDYTWYDIEKPENPILDTNLRIDEVTVSNSSTERTKIYECESMSGYDENGVEVQLQQTQFTIELPYLVDKENVVLFVNGRRSENFKLKGNIILIDTEDNDREIVGFLQENGTVTADRYGKDFLFLVSEKEVFVSNNQVEYFVQPSGYITKDFIGSDIRYKVTPYKVIRNILGEIRYYLHLNDTITTDADGKNVKYYIIDNKVCSDANGEVIEYYLQSDGRITKDINGNNLEYYIENKKVVTDLVGNIKFYWHYDGKVTTDSSINNVVFNSHKTKLIIDKTAVKYFIQSNNSVSSDLLGEDVLYYIQPDNAITTNYIIYNSARTHFDECVLGTVLSKSETNTAPLADFMLLDEIVVELDNATSKGFADITLNEFLYYIYGIQQTRMKSTAELYLLSPSNAMRQETTPYTHDKAFIYNSAVLSPFGLYNTQINHFHIADYKDLYDMSIGSKNWLRNWSKMFNISTTMNKSRVISLTIPAQIHSETMDTIFARELLDMYNIHDLDTQMRDSLLNKNSTLVFDENGMLIDQEKIDWHNMTVEGSNTLYSLQLSPETVYPPNVKPDNDNYFLFSNGKKVLDRDRNREIIFTGVKTYCYHKDFVAEYYTGRTDDVIYLKYNGGTNTSEDKLQDATQETIIELSDGSAEILKNISFTQILQDKHLYVMTGEDLITIKTKLYNVNEDYILVFVDGLYTRNWKYRTNGSIVLNDKPKQSYEVYILKPYDYNSQDMIVRGSNAFTFNNMRLNPYIRGGETNIINHNMLITSTDLLFVEREIKMLSQLKHDMAFLKQYFIDNNYAKPNIMLHYTMDRLLRDGTFDIFPYASNKLSPEFEDIFDDIIKDENTIISQISTSKASILSEVFLSEDETSLIENLDITNNVVIDPYTYETDMIENINMNDYIYQKSVISNTSQEEFLVGQINILNEVSTSETEKEIVEDLDITNNVVINPITYETSSIEEIGVTDYVYNNKSSITTNPENQNKILIENLNITNEISLSESETEFIAELDITNNIVVDDTTYETKPIETVGINDYAYQMVKDTPQQPSINDTNKTYITTLESKFNRYATMLFDDAGLLINPMSITWGVPEFSLPQLTNRLTTVCLNGKQPAIIGEIINTNQAPSLVGQTTILDEISLNDVDTRVIEQIDITQDVLIDPHTYETGLIESIGTTDYIYHKISEELCATMYSNEDEFIKENIFAFVNGKKVYHEDIEINVNDLCYMISNFDKYNSSRMKVVELGSLTEDDLFMFKNHSLSTVASATGTDDIIYIEDEVLTSSYDYFNQNTEVAYKENSGKECIVFQYNPDDLDAIIEEKLPTSRNFILPEVGYTKNNILLFKNGIKSTDYSITGDILKLTGDDIVDTIEIYVFKKLDYLFVDDNKYNQKCYNFIVKNIKRSIFF